jgi:hypothetical protein
MRDGLALARMFCPITGVENTRTNRNKGVVEIRFECSITIRIDDLQSTGIGYGQVIGRNTNMGAYTPNKIDSARDYGKPSMNSPYLRCKRCTTSDLWPCRLTYASQMSENLAKNGPGYLRKLCRSM